MKRVVNFLKSIKERFTSDVGTKRNTSFNDVKNIREDYYEKGNPEYDDLEQMVEELKHKNRIKTMPKQQKITLLKNLIPVRNFILYTENNAFYAGDYIQGAKDECVLFDMILVDNGRLIIIPFNQGWFSLVRDKKNGVYNDFLFSLENKEFRRFSNER